MQLPVEDVKLFYTLHWSLLTYASRHLKVLPRVAAFVDIGKQPRERVAKLRDALCDNLDLLDRFVTENPEQLLPEELSIVASWRHLVRGEFYVVRYLKPYTVFMSGSEEPPHLYGVLGLYDPIATVLQGAPLPVWVRATLLPFRDRIVYDGIINFYSIYFGRGFRTSINKTYNQLKEREGIIEQLVSRTGEPQIRTHLAGRAPRKPAPDWRPAVNEIVTQVEKMRQTDTKLQGAALGLLRATASLTQAALQEKDTQSETMHHLRSVRRALTKLERLLYEDRW